MERKSITKLRVPRAYNIDDLTTIFKNIDDNQKFDNFVVSVNFYKISVLREYLNLLLQLKWIVLNYNRIKFTERGNDIRDALRINSNLTNDTKNEILKDFLSLDYVKKFLKEIFDFEDSAILLKGKCLTIPEMEAKYQSYRNISKTVANREARTIYNWLNYFEILESLAFVDDKKNCMNVCYHIITNELSFEEFAKQIVIAYLKISNMNMKAGNLLDVEWINIPTIRKFFCSQFYISKEKFDSFFKQYVEKYPGKFQLATGSLLRKEVERERIEINNRLIFYLRLTEGDFDE